MSLSTPIKPATTTATVIASLSSSSDLPVISASAPVTCLALLFAI